jgi:hypothetical protein
MNLKVFEFKEGKGDMKMMEYRCANRRRCSNKQNNYTLLSASASRQWQEVEKMIAKKSIFDNEPAH